MKAVKKQLAMIMAFCMLFTAVQVVMPQMEVLAAPGDTISVDGGSGGGAAYQVLAKVGEVVESSEDVFEWTGKIAINNTNNPVYSFALLPQISALSSYEAAGIATFTQANQIFMENSLHAGRYLFDKTDAPSGGAASNDAFVAANPEVALKKAPVNFSIRANRDRVSMNAENDSAFTLIGSAAGGDVTYTSLNDAPGAALDKVSFVVTVTVDTKNQTSSLKMVDTAGGVVAHMQNVPFTADSIDWAEGEVPFWFVAIPSNRSQTRLVVSDYYTAPATTPVIGLTAGALANHTVGAAWVQDLNLSDVFLDSTHLQHTVITVSDFEVDSVAGSVPADFEFNYTSGKLEWAAASQAVGSYSFKVTAANQSNATLKAEKTYTLNILPAKSVITAASITAVESEVLSESLTITNVPADDADLTFAMTDASDAAFDVADPRSTAAVAFDGTDWNFNWTAPAAAGTYVFKLVATNNEGAVAVVSDAATVTVTVSAAGTMAFTPAAGALAAKPAGVAYSQAIVASSGSAGEAIAYELIATTGSETDFPANMTIAADGTLNWAAADVATGNYKFTVKATTDAAIATTTETADYTLEIYDALEITTVELPYAVYNTNYHKIKNRSQNDPVSVSATGGDGATISYAVAEKDGGSLPANFSIDAGTGVITWLAIPAALGGTTVNITVTATAGSDSVSKDFAIPVNQYQIPLVQWGQYDGGGGWTASALPGGNLEYTGLNASRMYNGVTQVSVEKVFGFGANEVTDLFNVNPGNMGYDEGGFDSTTGNQTGSARVRMNLGVKATTAPGIYVTNLIVKNAAYAQDVIKLTSTVLPNAPTFTTANADATPLVLTSGNTGVALSIDLGIGDATVATVDGDDAAAMTGAAVTAAGVLTWTPAAAGTYNFKVVAKNALDVAAPAGGTTEISNTTEKFYTLTITDAGTLAITTAADLGKAVNGYGFTKAFETSVTDNTGVSFTAAADPLNATAFPTGAAFVGDVLTISQADVDALATGTYYIQVTATDGSASDTQVFTLVRDTAKAKPMIKQTGIRPVYVGMGAGGYTSGGNSGISADNTDSDTEWKITGLPAGMTFANKGAVSAITITDSSLFVPGKYPVTVVAANGPVESDPVVLQLIVGNETAVQFSQNIQKTQNIALGGIQEIASGVYNWKGDLTMVADINPGAGDRLSGGQPTQTTLMIVPDGADFMRGDPATSILAGDDLGAFDRTVASVQVKFRGTGGNYYGQRFLDIFSGGAATTDAYEWQEEVTYSIDITMNLNTSTQTIIIVDDAGTEVVNTTVPFSNASGTNALTTAQPPAELVIWTRRGTSMIQNHLPVHWAANEPLQVARTPLDQGKINEEYSTFATINSITGTTTLPGGTVTFSLAPGSTMPDGLTLNADGTITGVPTTPGEFEFSVIATDGTNTLNPIKFVLAIQNESGIVPGWEAVNNQRIVELIDFQEDPRYPNVYIWQGQIRPTTDNGRFWFTLLPSDWVGSTGEVNVGRVNSGTSVSFAFVFRNNDVRRDWQLQRQGGDGGLGVGANDSGDYSWTKGIAYDLQLMVNVATNTIEAKIKAQDGSTSWGNANSFIIAPENLNLLSLDRLPTHLLMEAAEGAFEIKGYQPADWPPLPEDETTNPNFPYTEPDINNGTRYIKADSMATYHSVAYELFQPLRGNGTTVSDPAAGTYAPSNKLSFDLTVTEALTEPASISFNPKERIVTGASTRPWCIRLQPNGDIMVSRASLPSDYLSPSDTRVGRNFYVNTGAKYTVGQTARVDILFNFVNYTYTVSVDGRTVASNFTFAGPGDQDLEGRKFGIVKPNNMGIIGVHVPGGTLEMRNISAGIVNMVDNDATKISEKEINPVANNKGTRTFMVGPSHIYQKAQDVLGYLQPGDIVEIEATSGSYNGSYPGPLHYIASSGAANGTAAMPITIRGVGATRPEIRSGGSDNVWLVDADYIVFENLANVGHALRAMEVRGEMSAAGMPEAYMSKRAAYHQGGNGVVFRNCEISWSYHGVHHAGGNGDLLVEYSDIHHNGPDGLGHNLYLASKQGAVATIRHNYIHDTIQRSNNGLKSRMWRTNVYFNFFYNCDQAIELLSPGDRDNKGTFSYTTGQLGEVIGNVFVNCKSGMRLGGDGTGSGSRGRYRVLNNTYVNTIEGSLRFIRTFMAIESVEVYNNVVYAANSIDFYYNQDEGDRGTVWVAGERRFVGDKNWVYSHTGNVEFSLDRHTRLVNTTPAGLGVEIVRGGLELTDVFVDPAADDYRLVAGSPATAVVGVPFSYVYNWGPTELHAYNAIPNQLTAFAYVPVRTDANGRIATVARTGVAIGAFGAAGETVTITDPEYKPVIDDSKIPGASVGGPAPGREVEKDANSEANLGTGNVGSTGPIGGPGGQTSSGSKPTATTQPTATVKPTATPEPEYTVEIVDSEGEAIEADEDGNIVVGEDGATVSISNGTDIAVSEGSVIAEDGTVTVGDGGATTDLPGATVEIAEGAELVINKNGNVEINGEATVVSENGNTTELPAGSVINGDSVTVGAGGATTTYANGLVLPVEAGAIIVFDEEAPLGYVVVGVRPISDVPADAWYESFVNFVVAHGLMSVTADRSFHPQVNATREELVVIMYKMVGSPAVEGKSTFVDVDADSEAAAAIEWAVENKVVAGVGNDMFAPKATITREQMATIFYNFAKSLEFVTDGEQKSLADFADVDSISGWATPGVLFCYENDVMSGKPGSLFDPQAYITNAEVASMVQRFMVAISLAE